MSRYVICVGGRDGSRPERLRPIPEVLINRLVLWNIDLTLVDSAGKALEPIVVVAIVGGLIALFFQNRP